MQFIEKYGLMPHVIKHNGRLADLIVVAKPDRDPNLGSNALQAALFQTGQPVLMCPPMSRPCQALGRMWPSGETDHWKRRAAWR